MSKAYKIIVLVLIPTVILVKGLLRISECVRLSVTQLLLGAISRKQQAMGFEPWSHIYIMFT